MAKSVKEKKSFADLLAKGSGNEYNEGSAENGMPGAEIPFLISSGNYLINALISGSIYGGYPGNKITVLAGPKAVGKSFLVAHAMLEFQKLHPTGAVFLFESESAITTKMLVDKGVDVKRVYPLPIETVQQLRTQAMKMLDIYLKTPENERDPIMFILDSLGACGSLKEMEDATSGKDVQDMTRAKLFKSFFRIFTLKASRANCALIATNHVYKAQGLFPETIMGGGEGAGYGASTVLFLSKGKDKEGSGTDIEVVGSKVFIEVKKSRFTREGKKGEIVIKFDGGLSKYSGLVEFGIKYGIISETNKTYTLPDGTEVSKKELKKNPEKFYTKQVLDALDAKAREVFPFGTSIKSVDEEIEEVYNEEV